jgi:glycyl-tRNA synthetase beta chain
MTSSRDLLIEIGTEELPPKALRHMRDALQTSMDSLLDENRLAHGSSHAYATPRRLHCSSGTYLWHNLTVRSRNAVRH